MKTATISAMLGLFVAAATAQEAPPVEPAQPSIMAPTEPAQPAVETPAVPAAETPAVPAAETPAVPAVETPAVPAAETPAAPAVETPAASPVETPAAAPQPEVKAAPVPVSLAELKKSHGQAVADLKKKQEEAVAQLKASMKGKPIQEIRAAVAKQRTVDKAALKTLKDAQNAEMDQFKKDQPEAVKITKEVKEQESKTPAVAGK